MLNVASKTIIYTYKYIPGGGGDRNDKLLNFDLSIFMGLFILGFVATSNDISATH